MGKTRNKEPLKQHTSEGTWLGPHPKLIPPLADEFVVYGGDDVVERAREWALRTRSFLIEGVNPCAHAFYMMDMCPNSGQARGGCTGRWRDHVNVWGRIYATKFGIRTQMFLLAHPYVNKVPKEAERYAAAHGCSVESDPWDGWYGHRTIPIMVTPIADNIFWPFEPVLTMLYLTEPFDWPRQEEA